MKQDKGGIFGFGILTGDLLHQTEKPSHIRYGDFPDVISFDVTTGYITSEGRYPVPFSPEKLAGSLNRLGQAMQQGLRIDQYTSTETKGAWKVTILADRPRERFNINFVLKYAKDHRKVDAFFNSIRFGGYELLDARATGNTITLTRKRGMPRKYQTQPPPPRYGA